jgi:hypothetical protein
MDNISGLLQPQGPVFFKNFFIQKQEKTAKVQSYHLLTAE